MLCVVEGNLARITHHVPTLRMERIPMAMQDHVVGVPPSWLHLLWNVSMVVLCYRKAVAEAVATDEVEEPP